MNFKNVKFFIFIFFAVLFSGCAAKKITVSVPPSQSSEEFITVIAEGTADIRAARISEATDRAYLDAQRKAIETALGKIYSAKTVVEAGRFIEQTVMANVKGYIREWTKIAGPEVQDFPGITDKIIWVKIRAEVGKDKLKEDTLALEEIQKRLGRPDIAVLVENIYSSKVINSKLKEKKFTVRDLDIGTSDPVEIALKNKVEIIIEGKVSSSKAGEIMKGLNMKSYQSNVVLKAVNTSNGEILSQSSAHAAFPHIDDESGISGAIEKATESACDKLIEKLLAAWEDILNNGNNLSLKIKGILLGNESDFRLILNRYLRGLKEIHSKGFKEGVFTYKLKYLGDAKQLAKELNSIESKFNIEVTGYGVNTVEAEVR